MEETLWGFRREEKSALERTWTPEQQNAIDARGGGILVSAAAGSGKTAVLTERVIQRLTDPENPVDADRFLVVTFTRAAAGEMRSRISERLRELIRRNPASIFLQRQLTLLQQARICTMDSFFSGMVRENFEQLGVSQNLRVVDDAMLSRMTADTLEELLESRYANPDEGFVRLAQQFGEENDKALSKQILQLYRKLRSLPYPFQWLDDQLQRYEQPEPLSRSSWGRMLLEEAVSCLSRAVPQARRAMAAAAEDPVLQKNYLPALTEDLRQLEQALQVLKRGQWDESVQAVRDMVFSRLGSSRGSDPACKDRAGALRKLVKTDVEAAGKLLCCTEQEYLEDMAAQAPLCRALFSLVRELWTRLDRAKEENGVADFADFAYLTLRLLADPSGEPTPFAG